ncbi:MAG: hypothetical protein HY537_04935 [Deltaproteobacteria bacterium]|nr:hypothetical protein [Deltaproteobacteria bacterium]
MYRGLIIYLCVWLAFPPQVWVMAAQPSNNNPAPRQAMNSEAADSAASEESEDEEIDEDGLDPKSPQTPIWLSTDGRWYSSTKGKNAEEYRKLYEQNNGNPGPLQLQDFGLIRFEGTHTAGKGWSGKWVDVVTGKEAFIPPSLPKPQPKPKPATIDPDAILKTPQYIEKRKEDRAKTRKQLELASWRVSYFVRKLIPKILDLYTVENYTTILPYSRCPSPVAVPEDLSEMQAERLLKLLSDSLTSAQTQLAHFFETYKAEIGQVPYVLLDEEEHAQLDVLEGPNGTRCQPLIWGQRFAQLDEPEKTQTFNRTNPLMLTFFYALSGNPDGPITDIEIGKYVHWVQTLRNFYRLIAKYLWVKKSTAQISSPPDFEVQPEAGEKLAHQMSPQTTAGKIFAGQELNQEEGRFDRCAGRKTFCFFDPKRQKRMDQLEEVVLTLQIPRPKEEGAHNHGLRLAAEIDFVTIPLVTELFIINKFLPPEKQLFPPDGRQGPTVSDKALELYRTFMRAEKREWWAQVFAQAVLAVVQRWQQTGNEPTPVSPEYFQAAQTLALSTLSALLGEPQALADLLIDAADSKSKTPLDDLSLRHKLLKVRLQMQQLPFSRWVTEESGASGQTNFSSVRIEQLPLWAALVVDGLKNVSGSENIRRVLEQLLLDEEFDTHSKALLAYIVSFFGEENLPYKQLIEVWNRKLKKRWEQVINSHKTELNKAAASITDQICAHHPALCDQDELDKHFDSGQQAQQLTYAYAEKASSVARDAWRADHAQRHMQGLVNWEDHWLWSFFPDNGIFSYGPGSWNVHHAYTKAYESERARSLDKGSPKQVHGVMPAVNPWFLIDDGEGHGYGYSFDVPDASTKPGYHEMKGAIAAIADRNVERLASEMKLWFREKVKDTAEVTDEDLKRYFPDIPSFKVLALMVIRRFHATLEATEQSGRSEVAADFEKAFKPLHEWLENRTTAGRQYAFAAESFAKRLYDQYLWSPLEKHHVENSQASKKVVEESLSTLLQYEVFLDTSLPVDFLIARYGLARQTEEFAGSIRTLGADVVRANFLDAKTGMEESKRCDLEEWVSKARASLEDSKIRALYQWRFSTLTERTVENLLSTYSKDSPPPFDGEKKPASKKPAPKTASGNVPAKPQEQSPKAANGVSSQADASAAASVPPGRNPFELEIDNLLEVWIGAPWVGEDKEARAKSRTALIGWLRQVFGSYQSEKAKVSPAEYVFYLRSQIASNAPEKFGIWNVAISAKFQAIEAALRSKDPKAPEQLAKLMGTIFREFELLQGDKILRDRIADTLFVRALPQLILPSFTVFSTELGRKMAAVKRAKEDPIKVAEAAEKQLAAHEGALTSVTDPQARKELQTRIAHFRTMRSLARAQQKEWVVLKRMLENTPVQAARESIVALSKDKKDYRAAFENYLKDQFWDTPLDATGSAFEAAMTPRQILDDLNELGQYVRGYLPVDGEIAKQFLHELGAYCESGESPVAAAAFQKSFESAINKDELPTVLRSPMPSGPLSKLEKPKNQPETEPETESGDESATESAKQGAQQSSVPRPQYSEDDSKRFERIDAFIKKHKVGSAKDFCAVLKKESVAVLSRIEKEMKEQGHVGQSAKDYWELVCIASDVFFRANRKFAPLVDSKSKVHWFSHAPIAHLGGGKEVFQGIKGFKTQETVLAALASVVTKPELTHEKLKFLVSWSYGASEYILPKEPAQWTALLGQANKLQFFPQKANPEVIAALTKQGLVGISLKINDPDVEDKFMAAFQPLVASKVLDAEKAEDFRAWLVAQTPNIDADLPKSADLPTRLKGRTLPKEEVAKITEQYVQDRLQWLNGLTREQRLGLFVSLDRYFISRFFMNVPQGSIELVDEGPLRARFASYDEWLLAMKLRLELYDAMKQSLGIMPDAMKQSLGIMPDAMKQSLGIMPLESLGIHNLSSELFELMVPYTPYRYQGGQLWLPTVGQARPSIDRSRKEFMSAPLLQKRRVIDRIARLFKAEVEVGVQPFKEIWNAPSADMEMGQPLILGWPQDKALAIYTRYFAPKNADSQGVSIEEWISYCSERKKEGLRCGAVPSNEFKPGWGMGEKTDQAALFNIWFEALANSPWTHSIFAANQLKKPSSIASPHLWEVFDSLDQFKKSKDYGQLIGLLRTMDANAGLTITPETWQRLMLSLSHDRLHHAKEPQLEVGGKLSDEHFAFFMQKLVDGIGINVKDFHGYLETLHGRDRPEDWLNMAQFRWHALVGIPQWMFLQTRVSAPYCVSTSSWESDYNERPVPIVSQEEFSKFRPSSLSLEQYIERVLDPSLNERNRVLTEDTEGVPLYYKLMAIENRMASLEDWAAGVPDRRDTFAKFAHRWSEYDFVGVDTSTKQFELLKQQIRQKLRATQIELPDEKLINAIKNWERLARIRNLINEANFRLPVENFRATQWGRGQEIPLWEKSVVEQMQAMVWEWCRQNGIPKESWPNISALVAKHTEGVGNRGIRRNILCAICHYEVMRLHQQRVWAISPGSDDPNKPNPLAQAHRATGEAITLAQQATVINDTQQNQVAFNIIQHLIKLNQVRGKLSTISTDAQLFEARDLIWQAHLAVMDNILKELRKWSPEGANDRTFGLLERMVNEQKQREDFWKKAYTYSNYFLFFALAATLFGQSLLLLEKIASLAPTITRFAPSAYANLIGATFVYAQYHQHGMRQQAMAENEELHEVFATIFKGDTPLITQESGFLLEMDRRQLLAEGRSRWTWGFNALAMLSFAGLTVRGMKALGGFSAKSLLPRLVKWQTHRQWKWTRGGKALGLNVKDRAFAVSRDNLSAAIGADAGVIDSAGTRTVGRLESTFQGRLGERLGPAIDSGFAMPPTLRVGARVDAELKSTRVLLGKRVDGVGAAESASGTLQERRWFVDIPRRLWLWAKGKHRKTVTELSSRENFLYGVAQKLEGHNQQLKPFVEQTESLLKTELGLSGRNLDRVLARIDRFIAEKLRLGVSTVSEAEIEKFLVDEFKLTAEQAKRVSARLSILTTQRLCWCPRLTQLEIEELFGTHVGSVGLPWWAVPFDYLSAGFVGRFVSGAADLAAIEKMVQALHAAQRARAVAFIDFWTEEVFPWLDKVISELNKDRPQHLQISRHDIIAWMLGRRVRKLEGIALFDLRTSRDGYLLAEEGRLAESGYAAGYEGAPVAFEGEGVVSGDILRRARLISHMNDLRKTVNLGRWNVDDALIDAIDSCNFRALLNRKEISMARPLHKREVEKFDEAEAGVDEGPAAPTEPEPSAPRERVRLSDENPLSRANIELDLPVRHEGIPIRYERVVELAYDDVPFEAFEYQTGVLEVAGKLDSEQRLARLIAGAVKESRERISRWAYTRSWGAEFHRDVQVFISRVDLVSSRVTLHRACGLYGLPADTELFAKGTLKNIDELRAVLGLAPDAPADICLARIKELRIHLNEVLEIQQRWKKLSFTHYDKPVEETARQLHQGLARLDQAERVLRPIATPSGTVSTGELALGPKPGPAPGAGPAAGELRKPSPAKKAAGPPSGAAAVQPITDPSRLLTYSGVREAEPFVHALRLHNKQVFLEIAEALGPSEESVQVILRVLEKMFGQIDSVRSAELALVEELAQPQTLFGAQHVARLRLLRLARIYEADRALASCGVDSGIRAEILASRLRLVDQTPRCWMSESGARHYIQTLARQHFISLEDDFLISASPIWKSSAGIAKLEDALQNAKTVAKKGLPPLKMRVQLFEQAVQATKVRGSFKPAWLEQDLEVLGIEGPISGSAFGLTSEEWLALLRNRGLIENAEGLRALQRMAWGNAFVQQGGSAQLAQFFQFNLRVLGSPGVPELVLETNEQIVQALRVSAEISSRIKDIRMPNADMSALFQLQRAEQRLIRALEPHASRLEQAGIELPKLTIIK